MSTFMGNIASPTNKIVSYILFSTFFFSRSPRSFPRVISFASQFSHNSYHRNVALTHRVLLMVRLICENNVEKNRSHVHFTLAFRTLRCGIGIGKRVARARRERLRKTKSNSFFAFNFVSVPFRFLKNTIQFLGSLTSSS